MMVTIKLGPPFFKNICCIYEAFQCSLTHNIQEVTSEYCVISVRGFAYHAIFEIQSLMDRFFLDLLFEICRFY